MDEGVSEEEFGCDSDQQKITISCGNKLTSLRASRSFSSTKRGAVVEPSPVAFREVKMMMMSAHSHSSSPLPREQMESDQENVHSLVLRDTFADPTLERDGIRALGVVFGVSCT